MAEYDRPGAYDYRTLTIRNFNDSQKVDIKNVVVEMVIYEDFASNTLIGHLILYDALDLIHTLPIIGEEEIDLHVVNAGELNNGYDTATAESSADIKKKSEIKGTFKAYNISEIQRDSVSRAQAYKLEFVSPEFYKNIRSQISQAYTGKTINNYVNSIFTNSLYEKDETPKKIDIEPTNSIQDFVIPAMTPFEAMQFLAGRSYSGKNKSSSFVFYESHWGFHFITLESFFREPTSEKLYLTIANIADEKNHGHNIERDEIERNIISRHRIEHTNDILLSSHAGLYGSSTLTHDLLRKTYKTHSFNYKSDWESDSPMKHIDDFKLSTAESKNHKQIPGDLSFISTNLNQNQNKYVMERIGWMRPRIIRPFNLELFKNAERSLMAQMNTLTMNVVVPGNTDRMPGQIVEVDLPTASNLESLKLNKYLSGRWMIMNVRHSFSVDDYSTTMQLVKNSYPIDIEKETARINKIEEANKGKRSGTTQ